jgi:hypothetical protein
LILTISVPARADDAALDAELVRIAHAAELEETIVIEDTDPVTQVDTPSAGVRVVTARELELTPHKNTDDLLRTVPGLYMSQHGSEGKGQQFFLRGFDAVHGSDLAISVAGIPINELSNVHGQGYADLGFVVPEAVAGLVARKGPFDLEHGWFATAGSLDLELGVANRGMKLGYEIGSTNRHRLVAVAAPEDSPQAEFIAASVLHDTGYGENRGTEQASVLAQTELRTGKFRLRPMVAASTGTFGEPGVTALDDIEDGFFDRMDSPAGDRGGATQRVLSGINMTWKDGADELVGTGYLGWRGLRIEENFTGYLVSPEHGDARLQTHRAVTGGGRLSWRHRFTDSVRLLAGTQVARDQLVQGEDRIDDANVVWMNERMLDAATSSGAVWAGLEWQRGHWTATAGARGDALFVEATDKLDPTRSGAGSVGLVTPRGAIAYRTERYSVSFGAGRGVRPPEARAFTQRASTENMDATVYDGGDAAITAATALELGGDVHIGPVRLGATGFATWIDRESVFDHISGVNALKDGSRRFGTELFVEARPVSWLGLRGDATLVDARYDVTNNPIPGAPRMLASVEARAEQGPFAGGVAGRFLGPRPLLDGATAASATVVDALGTYTRGRYQLSLQIDNVLGMDWNEGEYNFASYWDASTPRSEIPRVHISPGRPFGVRAGLTVEL